jgi:hypothetical protein
MRLAAQQSLQYNTQHRQNSNPQFNAHANFTTQQTGLASPMPTNQFTTSQTNFVSQQTGLPLQNNTSSISTMPPTKSQTTHHKHQSVCLK